MSACFLLGLPAVRTSGRQQGVSPFRRTQSQKMTSVSGGSTSRPRSINGAIYARQFPLFPYISPPCKYLGLVWQIAFQQAETESSLDASRPRDGWRKEMRRGVHVDATHHSMASVDSQTDRIKVDRFWA